MFGKKKELEAAIEELKAKLSEQEALNARLEQTIEEYKRKEGAIANALTRAQSDAGKVIDEANAEGARIINKANEDKAAAHAEAESIIAAAQEEADKIKQQAEEYSRQSALKAEAFMQNYRESASKLNKALQRAAETAAAQAEHFRACIKDSNLDNEIEMAGEYIPEGDAGINADELPESYENPAELMRSIYKIENRQTTPAEEAEEPEVKAEEEAKEEHIEHADRGPTAMLKEEAADIEAEEQPMMTVNEIVGMRSAETSEEREARAAGDRIDDALNAIIDDVLQDS